MDYLRTSINSSISHFQGLLLQWNTFFRWPRHNFAQMREFEAGDDQDLYSGQANVSSWLAAQSKRFWVSYKCRKHRSNNSYPTMPTCVAVYGRAVDRAVPSKGLNFMLRAVLETAVPCKTRRSHGRGRHGMPNSTKKHGAEFGREPPLRFFIHMHEHPRSFEWVIRFRVTIWADLPLKLSVSVLR